MSDKDVSPAALRWAVASRLLAAVFGGYAFTSLLTVLLALILPMPRAQAVLTATMLSFAVYVGVVLWVFNIRGNARVWIRLAQAVAGASLLCLALLALAG